MLRHCMIVAARRYGWSSIHPLPQGKDPETIVDDVLRAYLNGDRNFDAAWPIEAQLKKGIESHLWALHKRKGSNTASIDAITDAVGDILPSDDQSPDFEAANNHDDAILFALLRSSAAVTKSADLQRLVLAIERGADDAASQAAKTGITLSRVYELRKKLKVALPAVLAEFNRGQEVFK
jgi:hypothetical protein